MSGTERANSIGEFQGQTPVKQEDVLRIREALKTHLAEIRAQEKAVVKMLSMVGDSGSDCFSCPGCEFFDNGFCTFHQDKIPKAHIAKGCDNWSDRIPFMRLQHEYTY